MSLGTKTKDPRDIRTYTFEWAAELDGDTIASYVFVVPAGLTTIGDLSLSATSASVILGGGTAGTSYSIRNTITRVTSGETLSKSGLIAVMDL